MGGSLYTAVVCPSEDGYGASIPVLTGPGLAYRVTSLIRPKPLPLRHALLPPQDPSDITGKQLTNRTKLTEQRGLL